MIAAIYPAPHTGLMAEEREISPRPAPASSGEEWLRSPERARAQLYRALAWFASVLASMLLITMGILWWPLLGYEFFFASSQVTERIGPIVLPTLLLIFAAFYLFVARQGQRERFEERQRQIGREAQIASRQAELIAGGDSQQAEMWALTNDRLRGYHERAYRQADQSFRNAQWAIVGGFVILAGTAAIAAWNTNLSTTSGIVIGVIGTVGAGLAAYIGRTFLRLQETTATHMRSYFDQPQETFRYLVAERLIDRIPEDQRTQTVEYLVQAVMLSGLPVEQITTAPNPPPQPPGGAGGAGGTGQH